MRILIKTDGLVEITKLVVNDVGQDNACECWIECVKRLRRITGLGLK